MTRRSNHSICYKEYSGNSEYFRYDTNPNTGLLRLCRHEDPVKSFSYCNGDRDIEQLITRTALNCTSGPKRASIKDSQVQQEKLE